MKILVLNYEFPPLGGGSSPITKDLAIEISKENKIDLITMNFNGLKKQEAINENFFVYRVNCFRTKKEKSTFLEMLSFLMPAYLKAKELIKKSIKENKKYDLIHCHFIFPTGIIAYLIKKKFKIPYIITSHGSDVPNYNPDRFKLLHFLLKPFWKKILNESEKIICPSERLKKLILFSQDNKKKDITEKKIVVIPNALNLTKRKINLEKKEKIILYAGRLFQRKGVQYLINAFDLLNTSNTKKSKDWKLFISGDGDYKKELEKIANKTKSKNKIKFLGWLDKESLYKLYEKSSIFVLPSSEESFGMVLIEAMMFGNAIITTKATGTEEVVYNSGLLINKDEKIIEKELKEKLESLINDKLLLNNYQKKSLTRAQNFSLSKISKKYIYEFENISNN
ncbi:MAG: glycosyltransferase family 4 protein [Candidatus Woesearchaeota archaeon]